MSEEGKNPLLFRERRIQTRAAVHDARHRVERSAS